MIKQTFKKIKKLKNKMDKKSQEKGKSQTGKVVVVMGLQTYVMGPIMGPTPMSAATNPHSRELIQEP